MDNVFALNIINSWFATYRSCVIWENTNQLIVIDDRTYMYSIYSQLTAIEENVSILADQKVTQLKEEGPTLLHCISQNRLIAIFTFSK